ncbi:transglycosylase SLT domain-containing protein [bacterium]|nr:transglycosylase SLT domain-containing protein [bacterium]
MSVEQIGLPDIGTQSIQERLLQQRVERAKSAATSGSKGDDAQLKKVSQDMEAIFLRILLDSMQKTVPEDSLMGGDSSGMETWRTMFNEKIADTMSSRSPVGLADMIYRQLVRERDGKVPPSETGKSAEGQGSSSAPVVPAADAAAETPAGTKAKSTSSEKLGGLSTLIQQAAERNGLDPALVSAVILQESGGDPGAVSPAGAQGLMQLMPSTADSLGVSDPLDPRQNLEAGARYLRQMLERFGGDEKLALAAYNAGPGAVERYSGVPPYRETRNYVKNVLSLRGRFSTTSEV